MVFELRCDQACDVAAFEACVDANDGHVGGARGEHAEQGGNAPEIGSIADTGWDRDDGTCHVAADGAGQCRFHASHHDDHGRLPEARDHGQQTLGARDANVMKLIVGDIHPLESLGRFGGDGRIGASGADDQHKRPRLAGHFGSQGDLGGDRLSADSHRAGEFVILGERELVADFGGCSLAESGNED